MGNFNFSSYYGASIASDDKVTFTLTVSSTVFRDFNADGVQSTSARSTTLLEPDVGNIRFTIHTARC